MGSHNCGFMESPKKWQIVVAFAALYIVWGSTYLGIRFAIESIPPFLMAGVRYFTAGLIMFLIARIKTTLKSSWKEWRTSLIVGACLLLGGNGAVTLSEKFISSGLAAVMVATVPIYVLLLGWISGMSPRPKPIVWLGLAGGFLGVVILMAPALGFSDAESKNSLIGMSILLVGSFAWSAGSLYSSASKTSASPFVAAAQQMVCGGGLMILVGLTTGELRKFHPSEMSMLSLGAFVYLVLIGAIVGFTAYIWLLRNCDPQKVATYAYVNPIVAVLLGAAFAGEKIGGRILVAASLIIGSVALVITAQRFKAKPKAQALPVAVPETGCIR
jgi:drug/metabolite transporter (DMT)-like permease